MHGESDGCELRSIEGGGGSPGVARTEKARSLGTRVWHQQDGSRPLDRWVVAKYRRGAIEDGSPEAAIVKKAAKLAADESGVENNGMMDGLSRRRRRRFASKGL